jgi:hypothetical protein
MIVKWNKSTIVALVVLIATMLVVVVLTYRPRSLPSAKQVEITEELRRIASSDPAFDFQEAISRKDFRLIGLKTVGLEIPGTTSFAEHLKYKDLLGVRLIGGTGDVLMSKQHSELQGKARAYAVSYNTMMLRYLRENPSILRDLGKDGI